MAPPRNYFDLVNLSAYPQMTFVESAIAKEWVIKYGQQFDSIEFNVRLGQGIVLPPDADEPTRRLAAAVSPRRADIVARVARSVTIVEVKVNISLGALGQLIGYRELWLVDHPETIDVELWAIGRRMTNDAEPAFRQQHIRWETFPRAAAGVEERES